MFNPQELEAAPMGGQRSLQRVLVVEDEGLLSMMLEDLLREAGASDIVVCRTAEEALGPARATPFDCAIVDVTLHGHATYEVADVLAGRGVPFLFCTGLNRHDLAERHRNRPLLVKPYGDSDFKTALALTMAGR
jgi:CheY-like chemotaxis protein